MKYRKSTENGFFEEFTGGSRGVGRKKLFLVDFWYLVVIFFLLISTRAVLVPSFYGPSLLIFKCLIILLSLSSAVYLLLLRAYLYLFLPK